jgi:hypothetical protein
VTWLTRLRVEEAGHDRSMRSVWELTDPLVFRSEVWGDLLFPPRFRTNYASVPRVPLVFLLAGDKAHKEAAGHDFPYTVHGLLKVNYDVETGEHTVPIFVPIDRKAADDLFLEMLLLNPHIGEGLAHTMHKAVRWFGQSSWEDETNILQPEEIRAMVR